MRRSRLWTGWALALGLSAGLACAGVGGAGGGSSAGSDAITSQQIREAEGLHDNVFQVVRDLRPTWLKVRGSFSFKNPDANEPVVYVDRSRRGGIEVLRQLRPRDVQEISYLSGSEATTRYGIGAPGGVIEVQTRRGG